MGKMDLGIASQLKILNGHISSDRNEGALSCFPPTGMRLCNHLRKPCLRISSRGYIRYHAQTIVHYTSTSQLKLDCSIGNNALS